MNPARALFGLCFAVLGAIALWRVALAPAPLGSKIAGAGLGAAMLALGVVRIAQYARSRGSAP